MNAHIAQSNQNRPAFGQMLSGTDFSKENRTTVELEGTAAKDV
jgi:hypothetical protein